MHLPPGKRFLRAGAQRARWDVGAGMTGQASPEHEVAYITSVQGWHKVNTQND